jgi:hypothetical protein
MLWPSLQKKDVDSSANDNNNTSYDDRGSVDVERPLTPSSPHCSSASAANAVVAAGETVCSVEAPRRRPHLKFLLPLAIPVPLRRPKLDFVRVYLIASGGEVVPLCRDDADWHFKRGLAKCDLSGRSDADWRQLKDLLLATAGTLKCYIAIKAVDII